MTYPRQRTMNRKVLLDVYAARKAIAVRQGMDPDAFPSFVEWAAKHERPGIWEQDELFFEPETNLTGEMVARLAQNVARRTASAIVNSVPEPARE